jgi:hypothetical protein
MQPDADRTDRLLAVYRDGSLQAALSREPGAIRSAVADIRAPLLNGAIVSGRLAMLEHQEEILGAIRGAREVTEVIQRLEAAGYEVLETPAAALAWLMRGA